MRGSDLPLLLRRACVVVALVVASTACGGGGGDGDAGGDGSGIVATDALAGPHRYAVTHENLGSCTGAAEDGQETLEFTFTDEGLTLANLDFDWTQEFEATADGEYTRTEETSEGYEWQKTLTLTSDGFVTESLTDDPVAQGSDVGLQPCLRYTYRLLD